MSAKDIIRAWKDEDFRLGLSSAQRATLPENPVGAIELADHDLGDVTGGDLPFQTLPPPISIIIGCYSWCILCKP